jgi:hypothetical protein
VAHPAAKLVIIDTLIRVRPRRGKSGDVYEEDYESIAPLKRVADEFNVALLVVHHTRKMTADDRQDMVSGSNGLAGAADTTLVLVREPQGPTLWGRGRDVEDMEHAMRFDPAHCLWSIEGDADARRERHALREILEAMLPYERGSAPGQIAKLLKQPVAKILDAMVRLEREGMVFNGGNGIYVVTEKGRSDERR